MQNFERQILIDLYESTSGLFAFTLYSRYKIKPSSIFIFIDKYSKMGIIEYNDDRLILTEQGREHILKHAVIIKHHSNKFSNIPIEICGNKLDINEPYLPNKNCVPEEILKLKKVE